MVLKREITDGGLTKGTEVGTGRGRVEGVSFSMGQEGGNFKKQPRCNDSLLPGLWNYSSF